MSDKANTRPGLSDFDLVDVKQANEVWNEYKLSDGTTLRIKTIVIEVTRAKNQFNAEGDPVYSVKSATLVDARVPEKLKKKKPK